MNLNRKSSWPVETQPVNIRVVHRRDETSRYVEALKIKFCVENPTDPAVIGRNLNRNPKADKATSLAPRVREQAS
jgi:hypothetical protein